MIYGKDAKIGFRNQGGPSWQEIIEKSTSQKKQELQQE